MSLLQRFGPYHREGSLILSFTPLYEIELESRDPSTLESSFTGINLHIILFSLRTESIGAHRLFNQNTTWISKLNKRTSVVL